MSQRRNTSIENLRNQFGWRRLRYLVVVNTRKNAIFPLFVLFGLLGVFTIFGTSAYFFGLFDPDSLQAEGISNEYDSGIIDTLYWSLKHLLDPGAFSEDYSASAGIVIIALINTIFGFIILGGVIGIVTNLIQSSMEELRRGGSAVHEFNHIVILGWNRKVISIIRFFEALKQKQPIVILANTDIKVVSEEIRLVERDFQNVRVMPQHGSPTLASELHRVSITNSRAIIMLADEGGVPRQQSKDIPTIKTLMQLENLSWPNGKPNSVVEITDKGNVDIADIATKSKVPIVSSSDFVSKTLVQCARYRGYSEIYAELFSFGQTEFVIRPVAGYENKYFGQVAHAFENSILLGVSWVEEKNGVERRIAILNPEPDYELFDDEELIVLESPRANQNQSASVYRGQRLDVAEEDWMTERAPLMEVLPYQRPIFNKILILGWNANILDILKEFDGHAVDDVDVKIVSTNEESAARRSIDQLLSQGLQNVRVDYESADSTSREVLNSLEMDSFDDVIILADESNESSDPDSRTVLTLLMLREMKEKKPEDFPTITAEFYDQDARQLCSDTPLSDAVISPEFVSMQLTHLARQPVLDKIYRELLGAGGIEIALRPVELYVPLDQECIFADLITATQQVNEIVFGVSTLDSSGARNLKLNPGNRESFVFQSGDQISVLAQQVYS